MKKTAIILFVLVAWFTISTCKKDGNSQNKSSNPNDTTKTLPPAPKVSITQTPLTILLPNNCDQSFIITNTGPKGSTLSYTVTDDGALGGFLYFGNSGTNSDTPVSNTLASGASTTISVIVNPNFVNAQPSLIGASLVLNVYTPGASNYTKIPVSVNISSIDAIAKSSIGTWSGTWSGATFATPAVPVSGKWNLNITAVDTATSTIAGTINMTGTDAYYNFRDSLIYQPVNLTISLNPSNASFNYNDASYVPTPANAQCKVITLMISYVINETDGTDGYDLLFNAEINTVTNKIIPGSGSFTLWYNGQISSGSVAGSKQ